MNVTLDLNTAHPDLILSKGNKHVTHGQSYNQTSHRDLKARSTFQARRGSCQGGGDEKGKLGTGQEGSQVLPRTMWGSHLSVTWEWFGAIGCYGHEHWAIASSPSLLFLKTALGWVRISLDYAFGHLSFYNMTKFPIYTSPSIFFSETAHPLHSLVPEYRFSWHHSHICNTSRENNLGFWMPGLDFKLQLVSTFIMKGNLQDHPQSRSRELQPHSGFKSDLVTDPFRDLTYPKLSDILPTDHNLISDHQRPLENPVGNAI